MLQAVKILFLSLAILFSFGFRSYDSTCEHRVEQTCETKACCKKSAKESPSTEKKDCKGECCVQAISLFKFDEFVFSQSSVQFKDQATFNVKLDFLKANSISVKQLSFAHSYLPKYEVLHGNVKQVQTTQIQCWLI